MVADGDAGLGATALREISWRILPLLGLGYGIAFMDRVNNRAWHWPANWNAAHPDPRLRDATTANCNRRYRNQIGVNTFRAASITAYLKNGGALENAAVMTNHASTRTTQLYDRRTDEISLDKIG